MEEKIQWDQNGQPGYSLYTAITTFGGQKCLDKRDRIYALRSLLTKPESVTPDYNLDARQLYDAIYKSVCKDIDYTGLLWSASLWREKQQLQQVLTQTLDVAP